MNVTPEDLADDLELEMARRGIEPVVRDTVARMRRAQPDERAAVVAALEKACGVSFGADAAAWSDWLRKLHERGITGYLPLDDARPHIEDLAPALLSGIIKETTLISGPLSKAWGTPLGPPGTTGSYPQLHTARPVGAPASAALVSRCRFVGRLGEGGMAEVYLIEHESGARYALRVVRSDMATVEFVARFERESRIALGLVHPHIIRTLEAGVLGDGRPYVATEHCARGSLADRFVARGAFDEQSAARWLCQAAEAMAYAWSTHRLLHRDLTPSNLLLDDADDLKVADLGLAKRLVADATAITAEGVALGSPSYVSPEQAVGDKSIDCRADLYSLGATFFHLVTGRPPFSASTTTEFAARFTADAPRARRIRPDVSEELDALLARLLDREVGRRPRDADELASLARALPLYAAARTPRAELTDAEGADPIALGVVGVPQPWGDRRALLSVTEASTGLHLEIALFMHLPVQFGRTRSAEVALPLRIYPLEANRSSVYEISRTHGRFEYGDGAWRVTDLGSRNGITLGGTRVASNVPQIIARQTSAVVGGVLALHCNPLPGVAGPVWIDGRIHHPAASPALVVTRAANRRELAYVLLRERLPLGGTTVPGIAWPHVGTLWWLDGAFHWQAAGSDALAALRAGSEWTYESLTLRLERLTPGVFS